MDQEQLQKARRRLHRRSHGSQGPPHGPRRRHRGRRQRHRRRQAGSPEGSRHRGGQDARPDGRCPGGSHEKQGNVSPPSSSIHFQAPSLTGRRFFMRPFHNNDISTFLVLTSHSHSFNTICYEIYNFMAETKILYPIYHRASK